MGTMSKALGQCQRHEDRAKGMGTDHAKGMATMLKAWGPYQRHGDHAKGMGTMPKAWRSCQRLRGHARGILNMPHAYDTLSKIKVPVDNCRDFG